jgi:Zn finger protein HypA/HybF involved in hydrogenase expression
MARKYSDQEFIDAVASSFSYREALDKIGLVQAGGNYAIMKKRIEAMELDTSHMTGQGHLRGKTHNWAKSIPLEEILVKDSAYGGGSYKLKKRLIKEKRFEDRCHQCGLSEWQGQKLNVELDHINGINTDNRIENLTLKCPNCHSLTDTYRGKNKKKKNDARIKQSANCAYS